MFKFTKAQIRDCRMARNMARMSCVKHLKKMEVAAFAIEQDPLVALEISESCRRIREWLEACRIC